MSIEKTIAPAASSTTSTAYVEAIRWAADNDIVGMMFKDAIDVDAVHERIVTRFVSDLYKVDQRVVATDIVRARLA